MKKLNVCALTVASMITMSTMTPLFAKGVKTPSIPKKTVVWVDTTSSKFKDAMSFEMPIKNKAKDLKITGAGVKVKDGTYTIPTSNKKFEASYVSYMAEAGVGIYAKGKVSDALIGQKGTLKFNVVQNHHTYHLSTSFVTKKNPGRLKYVKVNGVNILSKFKEDQGGDFNVSLKLANKKVKMDYKVQYPNKDHGVFIMPENGDEVSFKKNTVVKKGDIISIAVLAPGWERDTGYNIKVK